MTRPEPTIFTGWWDFAVRGFSLLTTPRADTARCDRDIEALARDSLAGGVVHAVSLAIRRAWSGSFTRAAGQRMIGDLFPSDGAGAWRVAGWMIAVAGVTSLALGAFSHVTAGPFIKVTPSLLIIAGLFVMACANPLSRAAADRKKR
jgi:hypothetical protein